MPTDTVKHTPNAPERIWAFQSGSVRGWIFGEEVYFLTDTRTEYVRADIADELLAAVKDARSMLAKVEVIDGVDGDPWSKALTRMDAAIAKATGASS